MVLQGPKMQEDVPATGHKRPLSPDRNHSFFRDWFQDGARTDEGHDELADALKDDLWPDPIKWLVLLILLLFISP
jgi:hypothetical protein